MPLSGGFRLGPYEILELIGAGGMGEVYRSRDARLGRIVAIKILKSELSARPEVRQRFLLEATAISNLSHANICALYDIGRQDEMDYLVMEYLDGATLASCLMRGRLAVEKAVTYATQIADALHHAHTQGIYHGDLKPGNIVVTASGALKLLDFGLARWKDPVITAASPTEVTIDSPGAVQGTLPYMAPEQIEGHQGNACSDIFALGITLYEMVNGQRPFTGSTQASLAASLLYGEPRITAEMQKFPALVRIINRCLAKLPQDRWQSARDLKLELEGVGKELHSGRRESDSAFLLRPAGAARTRNPLFVFAGITGVLVLILALTAIWPRSQQSKTSSPGEIKTLAVLPLKNLSADPSREYLAEAMTEELITTIARMKSLRVISHTSVMEYKNIQKPIPQIARELNADLILEGSILLVGEQMRISAQLIDGRSDHHIWAESYDRNLGNIFIVLNEVASSISGEIHIQLTPQEKAYLANAAPVLPEAYHAYLRGKSLMWPSDLSSGSPQLAVQMLERSVQLDPGFAVAHAELSRAHSLCYFSGDRDPDRMKKAKAAVDRAFELQPGIGEGHLALGYYYYAVFRDYDRALQEYSIAEKALPTNSILLASMASVYRRTGNFVAAAEKCKKIFKYSPREARAALDAGIVLTITGSYAEADLYYDSAIALAPNRYEGYLEKAWNQLLSSGNTEQARSILNRMPVTDQIDAPFTRFVVEMCDRNYEAALKAIAAFPEEEPSRAFRNFLTGYAQSRLNQKDAAQSSFQAALALMKKAAATGQRRAQFHATFGMIYAALGEKEEAIYEGKLAVEMVPVSTDAFLGPDFLEDLAFIYTLAGETDQAVKTLEYRMSIPGRRLSVAMLRIDPRWDVLRQHPGFRKLVEANSI